MTNTSVHPFAEKLTASIHVQKSSLCCGLDPNPERLPSELRWAARGDAAVIEFIEKIIDVTAEYVCAYKIQRAYFDLLEAPKQALITIIDYVRANTALPVILDAKIGETENTMKAYIKFCADDIKADALVLNPYMGAEVLEPFRARAPCGGVVLVRTSNSGAGITQDRKLDSGERLWELILRLVIDEYVGGADLIPILASTADLSLSEDLNKMPAGLPILVAGFGAQGGSLDLVRFFQRQGKHPLAVNSSREIIFAYQKERTSSWESSVASAARSARDILRG